jgi:hypothetical protein
MRVQAQHVFYLDFQLPEFHDPDGSLPIGIHYNDQVAIIAPWDHKGELFDGELGQTLRSAEFLLSPVAQSSGRLVRRVVDIAIDRLMVAIEWDHGGDPLGDENVIQLRLEEAVTYANFFISHLRAVTRSTHLNRMEVYWHPEDKTFQVQVPYHVQWIDTETNSALPFYREMNGLSSLGGIRVPGGGTVEWDDVRKSMSTGTLPEFHRTLLVDARDALTTADIREAILSIASACEVRIERYAETQTIITRTEARQITKPSPQLSFAKRHFDLLPSQTCGQSLSAYDTQLFEDVQSCYSQRNRLMHGGELLPPLDGMGIAERLRTVSQWLLSAENAIAWVDSLPTLPS